MTYLREHLTFDQARMVTETDNDGKDLFMKGICIQGGVKNANKRVYPVNEIQDAVSTLNEQINQGMSVLGEVDHPDDLKINLDRVSHMVTEMWMDGPNGYGKMKVLPTPMGNLVKTMLESGGKLGVSSRGAGNVKEASGDVSDFEIVTIDVVAQPSAPDAYPTAIYEGLLNMRGGHRMLEVAAEVRENQKAQKYLKEGILRLIEVFKPLIDNNLISEEARDELQEAWETKLVEATEQNKAELREEFAQRYEHDKEAIVEALDTMVTDSLKQEIQEFVEDKQAVVAERVAYKTAVTEHADLLNKFVTENLASEMQEFRTDRGSQTETFGKLEDFVIKALSEEIVEFNEDKQDVIDTKVKLVAEAKAKLAELKKTFIERSAKMVEETVTKTIKGEMSQLKEDIQSARENNFGRQLFEAFAAEYSNSYMNEKTEVAKLMKQLSDKENELAEASKAVEEKDALVEARESEIRVINDQANRKQVLSEMLNPLAKDKKEIMESLLESVQTEKLKASFDKYLPAVINGDGSGIKRKLTESVKKEVTGDREIKEETQPENDTTTSNIIDIKKLAGLN